VVVSWCTAARWLKSSFRQRAFDPLEVDRRGPVVLQRVGVHAVDFRDAPDALAVDAVLDHQQARVAAQQGRQHRFQRGGAGTTQQHGRPGRGVAAVNVQQAAAHAVLQLEKLGLAMAQVGAHRGLAHGLAEAHGSRVEQDRAHRVQATARNQSSTAAPISNTV
jgi:hypothetical protein